jgi:hypothetical protein
VLWNQSRLLKGLHHKRASQETIRTSIFVALFLLGCCAVWRGGGWLGNSSLSFSRSSLVSAEGCVERGKINQRVIDGGNSNLDHLHLDFCQLLQALPWASTPERAAVGDA